MRLNRHSASNFRARHTQFLTNWMSDKLYSYKTCQNTQILETRRGFCHTLSMGQHVNIGKKLFNVIEHLAVFYSALHIFYYGVHWTSRAFSLYFLSRL